MNYHIVDENENVIASFKHQSDRDFCLDELSDYHPDCEFLPITRKNYVYFEE